jgi:hypothetical protein
MCERRELRDFLGLSGEINAWKSSIESIPGILGALKGRYCNPEPCGKVGIFGFANTAACASAAAIATPEGNKLENTDFRGEGLPMP